MGPSSVAYYRLSPAFSPLSVRELQLKSSRNEQIAHGDCAIFCCVESIRVLCRRAKISAAHRKCLFKSEGIRRPMMASACYTILWNWLSRQV